MHLTQLILALALLGGPMTAEKLNLNTATKDQLVAAGLSEGQAMQVISHRGKNGPLLQVEELLVVPQITKDTFEKVRDRLTVDE